MDNQHFKIQEQMKKLNDLGYYPFQVHEFICDAVGTTDIDKLNAVEMKTLIIELDSQIKFAVGCQACNKGKDSNNTPGD